jgi:hypothetical protein
MQGQSLDSRKTRAAKRGRLAVLSALGVFLALQVAYHFPLSAWLPQVQDVEYGNKLTQLRRHLAEKPKDQPLVVAFGSSLTGMSLNPTELATCQPNNAQGPLVYNHAINGAFVTVQLICLRRLLENGLHPDCVLIETHPKFFLLDGTKNPPRKIRAWPATRIGWHDLAVADRYYSHPRKFKREWCRDQLAPWYSHRHMLQSWLMTSWVPEKKRLDGLWIHNDDWGWTVSPEYIEKCKEKYRDPRIWEAVHQDVELWTQLAFNDTFDGALHEMLDLCKREKIRVVLVWPPESSHYREHYGPELNQRIDSWFARLQAESGARFVNARGWVDDENFIDGWHVAPEGAATYTRRLETEVLQPIFQDARTSQLK